MAALFGIGLHKLWTRNPAFSFALWPTTYVATLTLWSLQDTPLGWKGPEYWYLGDRLACQGTLNWGQREVDTDTCPKGKPSWPREKIWTRQELDRVNGIEIQRSLPKVKHDCGEGFVLLKTQEWLAWAAKGRFWYLPKLLCLPKFRADWQLGQHVRRMWSLVQA